MLVQAPSVIRALESLRADEGGLYASAGELFSDAVFGRDSIECADDLIQIRPEIAREVIRPAPRSCSCT